MHQVLAGEVVLECAEHRVVAEAPRAAAGHAQHLGQQGRSHLRLDVGGKRADALLHDAVGALARPVALHVRTLRRIDAVPRRIGALQEDGVEDLRGRLGHGSIGGRGQPQLVAGVDGASGIGDLEHVVLRQAATEQEALYVAPGRTHDALGEELQELVGRPGRLAVGVQTDRRVEARLHEAHRKVGRHKADNIVVPFEVSEGCIHRGLVSRKDVALCEIISKERPSAPQTVSASKKDPTGRQGRKVHGAGDGTRTREYKLGKLGPYHLATPACVKGIIAHLSPFEKKHIFRHG